MMGLSTLAALGGIGMAFVFYGGGYRAPAIAFAKKVPGLVALVRDKFRIDELYGFLIIRPLQALCRIIFQLIDRILIDKILVGAGAFLADLAGRAFRFFQTGDIQRYLAVFAIGLAVLVWVAARPTAPDEVLLKVQGKTVTASLEGPRDNALTYSFDFDGDGTADREGANPNASWTYSGPDRYTVTIVIQDSRWHTQRIIKRDVEIR